MKQTIILPNMYYSMRNVLSYNRLFNYICGGRTIGKTYAVKKHCCSQFEKTGDQFIFVRRYRNELALSNVDFFNAFATVDADAHFAKDWSVGKDGTYLCCGEVGGYSRTLDQLARKGLEFPNVGNIFFDEFIGGVGYNHYYPNEWRIWWSAYSTVCRIKREVKCYLCANNISNYNPYFLALGYSHSGPENEIWAPSGNGVDDMLKETVIEWISDCEATRELAKTRVGKALSAIDVGKHILYNESLVDNNDFLKNKGRYSDLLTIIRVSGHEYGIWYDRYTEDIFVSYSVGNRNCDCYAVTESDMSAGYYNFRALRSSGIWVIMTRSFDYGKMYYEDVICKGAAMEMFKRGR